MILHRISKTKKCEISKNMSKNFRTLFWILRLSLSLSILIDKMKTMINEYENSERNMYEQMPRYEN